MRILVTTHPALGHFHPLVPMANALKEAGHEVAFATAPSFQATIESNGYRFFACGIDWSGLGFNLEEFQKRQSAHAQANSEERLAMAADMFINQFARRSLPELLSVVGSFKPQVILRDSMEFAGCIAAEHLGLPHASIQVGAGTAIQHRSRVMTDKLDEVRALVGLPPDPEGHMLYRYLHLSFVPPRYHADSGALPPTVHSLRPVLFDQSGSEGLPPWAARLGSRPVVYLTLGTVFNRIFHPFSTIIGALRDEPIELIVTIGRDQDPARLGPQPENVHIERYIPQTLIFPKCDMAILHGGFNSVISALCHGLPLLIVPLAADQPMNAARCRELGVAEVLLPTELSAEKVRTAVLALLKDPSYRTAAKQFQAESQTLPELPHAVRLLERLAVEKKPIV